MKSQLINLIQNWFGNWTSKDEKVTFCNQYFTFFVKWFFKNIYFLKHEKRSFSIVAPYHENWIMDRSCDTTKNTFIYQFLSHKKVCIKKLSVYCNLCHLFRFRWTHYVFMDNWKMVSLSLSVFWEKNSTASACIFMLSYLFIISSMYLCEESFLKPFF